MGNIEMNTTLDMLDMTTVSEAQVPSIISTQFSNLTELENNVRSAAKMAAISKTKAKNAQISVGLFKQKKAITLLQDAVQGNAEAQISLADAQKLLFEYQTQLTKITKFLFGLGVCNIAMNRSVVRELKKRLEGASEKDISDLAKQELRNVILQLNAQVDMMAKQEDLKGKVKEQAIQLNRIDKRVEGVEENGRRQEDQISKAEEQLSIHSKMIEQQLQAQANVEMQIQKMNLCIESSITKMKNELDEKNASITSRVNDLEKELLFAVDNLKKTVDTYRENNETSVNALIERLHAVEELSRKKAWKIGVSAVALASVILNILQIIGVF